MQTLHPNHHSNDSIPSNAAALLETLRSIVGAAYVLCEGDLSAWEQDWRKRQRGRALAVVRPRCTAEVAAVVQACGDAKVAIVPQGGNTGLVLGSIPDDTGTQVLLSLTRLNRIRQIDAHNLTLTAEAGCVLQTLQEACAAQGLLLPLSLASQGSCTLGGNLGSNAGGTQVLRYGNARELCLGLEVVSAQGEVWDGLTGLRKDNTGYDLRHLFIGSEGTLGIITAAVMKLYPMPAAMPVAWVRVPSLEAAVQLLGLAQQHLGAGLTGFEVMGQFALSLVSKHFPQIAVPWSQANANHSADEENFCVLLEHSLPHRHGDDSANAQAPLQVLLEAATAQGWVEDAVLCTSVAQAQALWHIRESIPLAQAQEGLNIKHDIALPISRIPAFVRSTDTALRQTFAGVRLVNYGHLGDGNLHYNVQAPLGVEPTAFLSEYEDAIHTVVYEAVSRMGGSISAEHGIGSLNRAALAQYKSPVALGMMRSIKRALDPHNLMNPHRVLQLD